MSSPVYLISKFGDPLFAAVIGLAAAGIRIKREEEELGHNNQQTLDAALRRTGLNRFRETLARNR